MINSIYWSRVTVHTALTDSQLPREKLSQIMANLRLSLLITFFSSNGSTLIYLIVSIVLARLLSPTEIGIFSITAVLTSIAHIFRDFGVGSYLQREKSLTPGKIRTAMGVLITSSWLLALILFFMSGYIAEYYKQPGIDSIMPVLALGFVFIPFGAVTRALLVREYRAKEQAFANLAGAIAYATSAIGLAYLGFSYMSMAWANLINILVTVIAYAPFRPKDAPWIPSLRGWKKIVHFGTGAILGNTVGTINAAIPDIVLGKISGPYDVGILSRAMSTTNIFSEIAGPTIHYAALPFLAKKHHNGENLDEPLSKAVSYLTVCAWPAIMVTAVFAEQIILFLYGNKWLGTVPIIQILCFRTAINISLSFTGASLLAIGQPYLEIIPSLSRLLFTVPAIIYIYDGNLESFAYALFLSSVMAYPVTLWIQAKFLGFQIASFFGAQIKSLFITIICIALAFVLNKLSYALLPVFQLLTVAVTLTPIWIWLIKYLKHPIFSELETIGTRIPIVGKIIGLKT